MNVAICLLSLWFAFIVKVWWKGVLSHNMDAVYEVETHNKQKEICSKKLGETRLRFRTAVVWELLVFKTSSHRVHPSSLTCIFCKHILYYAMVQGFLEHLSIHGCLWIIMIGIIYTSPTFQIMYLLQPQRNLKP